MITLLAVTGLTHRQAYRDIFAITVIKTLAVFVVIATCALTGLYRRAAASGTYAMTDIGRRRRRAHERADPRAGTLAPDPV